MRISIWSTLLLSLTFCSNPNQSYEQQSTILKTLEGLLSYERGIAGTDFIESPRFTEIHRQNPTDISWMTNTWDWKNVNFNRYPGGQVEAIYKQAKLHESQLKKIGFRYMTGDFYSQPDPNGVQQPVGWYRKSVIKYNKLEQTGVHQTPINRIADTIVCKRVYINQTAPGILFASYRFKAATKTLTIDLAYSSFPGKLQEFETYQFQEKLVTE